MVSSLPKDGARRAGELLSQMLSGPYRHVWLGHAGRLREGEINRLAVAHVVANYLWEAGERADTDRELPRQIRDRVERALTGEVLTPATLEWFINAFRMDGSEAARLWALLSGEDPAPLVADGDWYVKSLSTLLVLDGCPPTATERRVIVATRNDLREITTSVSVPRSPGGERAGHGLVVEVLEGGTIEAEYHPQTSHFQQVLTLPEPIDIGQTHEFVIRRSMPEGQPMAPHYVQVPYRRIDHFELRVRFGASRPPPVVWRLSGVPTSVIYDGEPTSELVPCEDGEAHTYFRSLSRGLAYGLCWA